MFAEEPSGARMHLEGVAYDKSAMAPMYYNESFTTGKLSGLTELYNILLRMFRNNIAPQAGTYPWRSG